MLINDFNERFHDLKVMEFSFRLSQPVLADLSTKSEQCQRELCELQQNESIKNTF